MDKYRQYVESLWETEKMQLLKKLYSPSELKTLFDFTDKEIEEIRQA